MDGKTRKLAQKLGDTLAADLVRAGLDTPRKIRTASDEDIEDAVGKNSLADVRARMPKLEEGTV